MTDRCRRQRLKKFHMLDLDGWIAWFSLVMSLDTGMVARVCSHDAQHPHHSVLVGFRTPGGVSWECSPLFRV